MGANDCDQIFLAGTEGGDLATWLDVMTRTGSAGWALAAWAWRWVAGFWTAGCDLAVFNRSMGKAEPLIRRGAKPAGSAAELAARDIVFITVGSSDDLISAVLGPDGLMSGPGTAPRVLIDCSTVSAEASARVRAELAGRGTALLAAPVMGNPKVVRAGKMTAAVSGPARCVRPCGALPEHAGPRRNLRG